MEAELNFLTDRYRFKPKSPLIRTPWPATEISDCQAQIAGNLKIDLYTDQYVTRQNFHCQHILYRLVYLY